MEIWNKGFRVAGFADLKSMLESVKGTAEMKPENRSRPEQKRVGGPFEVLPGIGLGPLRFRMTQAQIKEILGSPEESAEFDSDMHFYYDSLGILLFFSGEVRGILSGIEVNAHCCCILAGRNLFPSRRGEIIELLRSVSSGVFEIDTADVVHLEDERQTRVTSKNLGMDFYFLEDGALESVNWCEM